MSRSTSLRDVRSCHVVNSTRTLYRTIQDSCHLMSVFGSVRIEENGMVSENKLPLSLCSMGVDDWVEGVFFFHDEESISEVSIFVNSSEVISKHLHWWEIHKTLLISFLLHTRQIQNESILQNNPENKCCEFERWFPEQPVIRCEIFLPWWRKYTRGFYFVKTSQINLRIIKGTRSWGVPNIIPTTNQGTGRMFAINDTVFIKRKWRGSPGFFNGGS